MERAGNANFGCTQGPVKPGRVMGKLVRVQDLDIDQDLKQQQAEWALERVGWVLWTMAISAALAGLLGPGPLSSATAGEEGSPLRVEYRRFDRHEAETLMRVQLGSVRARTAGYGSL